MLIIYVGSVHDPLSENYRLDMPVKGNHQTHGKNASPILCLDVSKCITNDPFIRGVFWLHVFLRTLHLRIVLPQHVSNVMTDFYIQLTPLMCIIRAPYKKDVSNEALISESFLL